jgi:predicted 3-demethylubiquinone-9 3-methyltransferase (glyoxalase superfamily)
MFVGDQLGRAEEAMDRYVSAFPGSSITAVQRLGPEDAGAPGIRLAHCVVGGQELRLMDSAGPHEFTFTPAISLTVACDTVQELDAAWERLLDGGMALMPLQEYPFSPRFGWLQDRFGVSWQLSLGE